LSDDPDDLEAIQVLLGAGTLGGARPKASVRDGRRLLVAKFPKPTDEWDVIAWEATALDIAERAGVNVPGRRLILVNGRAVLLLDRFDRAADTRIGYPSAMTLLGATDGQSGDYVDFAEALAEVGVDTADPAPGAPAPALFASSEGWRRVGRPRAQLPFGQSRWHTHSRGQPGAAGSVTSPVRRVRRPAGRRSSGASAH